MYRAIVLIKTGLTTQLHVNIQLKLCVQARVLMFRAMNYFRQVIKLSLLEMFERERERESYVMSSMNAVV